MHRPRLAVVVAAGRGRRFGERPWPKPLAPVAGAPLLQRSLAALAAAGVTRAVVVVGHRGDEVIDAIGPSPSGIETTYVVSDRYDDTDNIWSLWLARQHLAEDAFVLDGDVVVEPALLDRLVESALEDGASAVAAWKPSDEGTVLRCETDGSVGELLVSARQVGAMDRSEWSKTINVHLLRRRFLVRRFVPELEALVAAGSSDVPYECALSEPLADGARLAAVSCDDLRWAEVDDDNDLTVASYRFGTGEDRVAILSGRYGGYAPFGVVDHSLLRNPHFPPRSLLDALARDLAGSVTDYPVGQRGMADLVGAFAGVDPCWVAVGNGASEIIAALGRVIDRVVLAAPAFGEYEAVFRGRSSVVVQQPPEFVLDVPALVEEAARTAAGAVVLTSPGNPTSVGVPRPVLVDLAAKLAADGRRLIVDESFVDFCPEPSSLTGSLAAHPNVVIVTSLGKAQGVAGVRLGHLATADPEFVEAVRAQLPIWNVSGPAESFLRLLPRYRPELEAALALARSDRDVLFDRLSAVPGLVVGRPDANFCLVRLPAPHRAVDVVRELLDGHGIWTKDCTGKDLPDSGAYVRIASRTAAENRQVADALSLVLERRAAAPPVGALVR